MKILIIIFFDNTRKLYVRVYSVCFRLSYSLLKTLNTAAMYLHSNLCC